MKFSQIQIYKISLKQEYHRNTSMKQQQDTKSQEVSFQNSQSWSYIWAKLKYSVFDVLFVLLDNSQSQGSMFGLVFQTGVDYLQMLTFPFNPVVLAVWNNNTLDGVTNFFKNFNVSSYLPGVDFSTFIILLYALIFLIILVICDIIYVAYSFSKKKFRFTFPLIFMAKVVPIIVTVMFLPIMQTLLNVVNCSNSQQGQFQVLTSFPDVICWEGWHLFHTSITLFFSFMFVFISCIVALALFEPRMTTNSLTARQNSTGQVVFIINKIICQFIFSFSPFQGTLPYCLLLFVLSCWLYYTYNVNQPYYNKNASKFFRICSTYYFWTNLMLLVSQLLAETGFEDGLVIWICGMIFIGITIIFQRKSNIDTLFSSSLKFKSGQQLQSHLQYVLKLHHHKNEDKNSYMLLLGYIEKHIEICLEQDCPLRNNKGKFMTGKQQEEHSCKQLLKQIQRMFHNGIKKYPQCTKLRLTFAFFYMEKYQNNAKAYSHFTKALTTEPSFGEQFIIYRFKKIIHQKLEQQKQNKQEDLIQLIKFDNHVALCEQGMLISGKLHKQFWIQLREQSPNLQRLNLIGARIIETRQMVKQNYKQIIRLSNDGLFITQLQYNYALYLLYISHETKKGNKLLQKVKRKYEIRKRKQQNLVKPDKQNKINEILNTTKGLVVCELQLQQNGNDPCCRIKKVNNQFLYLSKYKEEDLIDRRLDKILPKILQDCHDIKVRQWLQCEQKQRKKSSNYYGNKQQDENTEEERKNNYVGNSIAGYLKLSSGFIIKIKYQVHFVPLQVKFVTEMKKVSNSNFISSIICDPEGVITEFCQLTLYRFPVVTQTLQIQKIIGYGVIQSLKCSEEESISISIQYKGNKRKQSKNYVCSIQKLQVDYVHPSQAEHQKTNLNQTISSHKQLGSNSVGIIVNIMQKANENRHNSLMRDRQQNKFTRDSDQRLSNQGKKYNNLSKVSQMISHFYNRDISASSSNNDYSFNHGYAKNDYLSIQPSNIKIHIDEVNINSSKHGPNKNYQICLQDGNEVKIKVLRYRNGEYQRIYYDNLLEQYSQYDFEQKQLDIESKLSKEKMQNSDYQDRIKKSLNTYIYHPQITSLFTKSILLFIVFMAVNLSSFNHNRSQLYQYQTNRLQSNSETLKQLYVLTSALSFNMVNKYVQGSMEKILSQMKVNFQIGLGEQVMVNDYVLENKEVIDIHLTNSLIRIQSNLLRYADLLEQKNQTVVDPQIDRVFFYNLGTVYQSYITSVSVKMQESYLKPATKKQDLVSLQQILIIVQLLISFVFVWVWIYQSLTIKHKIFQILIWFLDIPFNYITFAEKQCINFTKNYVQFRKYSENSEKSTIQYDHVIVEYKSDTAAQQLLQNQAHQENLCSQNQEDPILQYRQKQQKSSQQKHQQEQEQQKHQNFENRQLLINRYRKIGLFSKFSVKQIFKFIVFVFVNSFLSYCIYTHSEVEQQMRFINQITNTYCAQIIQLNKLVILMKMASEKYGEEDVNKTLWDNFSDAQMERHMESTLSEIRSIADKQIGLQIQIGLSSKPYASAIFSLLKSLQLSDLCQSIAGLSENSDTQHYFINHNQSQCRSLLNGTLKGGYSTVRSYIKSEIGNQRAQEQLIDQLEKSLRMYVMPQICSKLEQLIQMKTHELNNREFITNLLFYIMVLSSTVFMLPWNLYLRRLNIKINQTIQILNIIPMVLIPIYRKETRDFLKWVVFMASQCEEGDDSEEAHQG